MGSKTLLTLELCFLHKDLVTLFHSQGAYGHLFRVSFFSQGKQINRHQMLYLSALLAFHWGKTDNPFKWNGFSLNSHLFFIKWNRFPYLLHFLLSYSDLLSKKKRCVSQLLHGMLSLVFRSV